MTTATSSDKAGWSAPNATADCSSRRPRRFPNSCSVSNRARLAAPLAILQALTSETILPFTRRIFSLTARHLSLKWQVRFERSQRPPSLAVPRRILKYVRAVSLACRDQNVRGSGFAVGGGTALLYQAAGTTQGPSPRGRGNLIVDKPHEHGVGAIPAWAGEPLILSCKAKVSRGHARVGGGTALPVRQVPMVGGPSPRGRGNLAWAWAR